MFVTEDCAAGHEKNATGHCVLCARGYWRDLLTDDCQQCTSGTTTIPGEVATSLDKCSMGRFELFLWTFEI